MMARSLSDLIPLGATASLSLARCEHHPHRRRRSTVVVRAGGPPSSTTLTLVFVLPLSLLAGTVFASIRIADKLDQQYLQELAMNEAIAEEDEDAAEATGEDGGLAMLPPLPPRGEDVAAAAAPRVRNRPRRQA